MKIYVDEMPKTCGRCAIECKHQIYSRCRRSPDCPLHSVSEYKLKQLDDPADREQCEYCHPDSEPCDDFFTIYEIWCEMRSCLKEPRTGEFWLKHFCEIYRQKRIMEGGRKCVK